MPLGPKVEQIAARRWARLFAQDPERETLAAGRAAARPGGRLRVGFVSSDFREHPVALLLIECWERIDRRRIETFAYIWYRRTRVSFGQRVAGAFDHFTEAYSEAPATTARRIRADGIEVLIDLNGYTTHARERDLCPAAGAGAGQLAGLPRHAGSRPGTTTCSPIASSRRLRSRPFFTERLLYLPHCYCPSDTTRPVAGHGARACRLRPAGEGVVFCCFNNSYKILPDVFAVWMRVLSAVPGSVLWLAPSLATACANLRREAAARGVDPARLIFAPLVSLPEHLARYVHADLFLDTTPYNAGTTANDALFMGVPVLTCAGDTMASRVAGSQLDRHRPARTHHHQPGRLPGAGLTLASDPALLRHSATASPPTATRAAVRHGALHPGPR